MNNIRSFEELLSNNEYTVKVTYLYNLNDGNSDHEIVEIVNVKTDALNIPEVKVESVFFKK